MIMKEENEKTTNTQLLKVTGSPRDFPEDAGGRGRCSSEQNITCPCPAPSSPSHTYIELGLYTTDFEGQFSMSNSLFGVQWLKRELSAGRNMNLNQY